MHVSLKLRLRLLRSGDTPRRFPSLTGLSAPSDFRLGSDVVAFIGMPWLLSDVQSVPSVRTLGDVAALPVSADDGRVETADRVSG